ncbi:DUF6786 family protein [Paenibacillus sp. GCM10027626]|uniref:DUF6786 family protein n=1 Tax=Paenibacillus sp. GCM10027626 TaxID=3273411 RepID=UPI00363E8EBA
MEYATLLRALTLLEWRHHSLVNRHGGIVVVLERGARVIGVFTDEQTNNHLWVNPLLTLQHRKQSGDETGIGKEWNTGGDRMWLSPEIEYNVRDRHAFWDSYSIQESIDPGTYESVYDPKLNSLELKQHAQVHAFRSGLQASVRMNRVIRCVNDPVKASNCRFAGYEVESGLVMEENAPNMPIALWNIMQLPAGGDIVVPTRGRADVDDFFAHTGKSHLQIDEREVHFRLDARSQHKISIKAPFVKGRAAYVRHYGNGRANLLVRQFQVEPSGNYLDAPAHDPEARGHCLQCYNDSGDLGNFGELEYHTPAMDAGAGKQSIRDSSQVWCYEGTTAAIMEIQEALLHG